MYTLQMKFQACESSAACMVTREATERTDLKSCSLPAQNQRRNTTLDVLSHSHSPRVFHNQRPNMTHNTQLTMSRTTGRVAATKELKLSKNQCQLTTNKL